MKREEYYYHYTTASSLLNIFRSKQFWISKSTFMNDPNEINYAMELFFQELDMYSEDEKPFFKPIKEWLTGVNLVHDYFIFSLSSNSDSLSLWKRYGNDNGYSIKIEKNRMIEEIDKLENKDIRFNGIYKMIYDKEFQKIFLTQKMKEYLIAQKNNASFPIDSEDTVNLTFEIYSTLFIFKHNSYKDEEEVRVIFTLPNTKSLITGDVWRKNINFRANNNIIIPYIRLQLDLKNIIKGIKLGPLSNDLRDSDGLKEFLQYQELELPIENSTIPYRK